MVLVTSRSFYLRIIESTTISGFRESILELNNCDLTSNGVVKRIEDIEKGSDSIIEIYGKNDAKSDNFDKRIYLKYTHDVYYTVSKDYNRYETFNPMIDFSNNKFNVIRTYSDGSKVGTLTNINKGYKYYILTKISDDGNYLFVTAVRYAVLESQAKAVSFSTRIITLVIFVIVSAATYFYVTRITKPLQVITNVTKNMAAGKDKSLRIPKRKRKHTTETDATIENINTMYASLILAQEQLEEKSTVLTEELEQRDSEQRLHEEFIADTSHELKTPIAIIQGYAEGIQYILDKPAEISEYCDTIIEECTRMTDLVVNMMSLFSIKRNVNLMNYEVFSIRDYIAKRLQLHQKIFEIDHITVKNMITDDIYGIADLSKLQFVLNNLLSNAVSYIGSENKLIRIRYEDLGIAYRIFIFNSGNPIPKDKLEMLWMSFYRGDSARVRADGHFGLGLAIIKAVQDAHSQQCGVDNTDGGVEFWFDIQSAK